jgi:CRISPR-associated protein Cmr1
MAVKYTLQTLTPLHTGGVAAGQMDRIHETGIIGSLRWWYETILRGLVGTGSNAHQVCDPTGDPSQRCNYERHGWVCRACDLFGATGWKRRFSFDVKEGGVALFRGTNKINIVAPGGYRGWYFSSPYISTGGHRIGGNVNVLRDRVPNQSPVENDLRVVAELVNKWGALGAKAQHGFGIVNLQFDGELPSDIGTFLGNLIDNNDDQGFPTLGNMFFALLRLRDDIPDSWWKSANLGIDNKDQAAAWRLEDKLRATAKFSVPIAPAVKYKLRFGNGSKSYLPVDDKCANYFFGEVRKNSNQEVRENSNQKAKINISSAYKNTGGEWEFRIWGWVPFQGAPNGVNRNQLIAELHGLVTEDQSFWDSIFDVGVIDLSKSGWREKDATGHGRNTKDEAGKAVSPATTAAFLRCLLPRAKEQR